MEGEWEEKGEGTDRGGMRMGGWGGVSYKNEVSYTSSRSLDHLVIHMTSHNQSQPVTRFNYLTHTSHPITSHHTTLTHVH